MPRLSLQSPLLRAALRRPTATAQQQLLPRSVPTTTTTTTARTFTNLPILRPTFPISRANTTVFRAPNQTIPLQQRAAPQPTATAASEGLDVVAKHSITAHPALAGVGAQMRCGPRPTMAGATRLVQKRRHGFLSRIRKHHGRNTLARRRAKGRKRLSA
ncbi:Large ribosomal subunit protein bL34m [Madurella fahalii]|uniref:Large ribosomal subunit protein bL34m n=1 Tax=Madurella fahalii TaxID=1157608 RepID=A0ABQ0G8T0_9PEZI